MIVFVLPLPLLQCSCMLGVVEDVLQAAFHAGWICGPFDKPELLERNELKTLYPISIVEDCLVLDHAAVVLPVW